MVHEGSLHGDGLTIGIVVARWNSLITRELLAGASDTLRRHGVAEGAIDIVWVPGAFEIPLAARWMAETGRYAAIVALGAVIRGGTCLLYTSRRRRPGLQRRLHPPYPGPYHRRWLSPGTTGQPGTRHPGQVR